MPLDDRTGQTPQGGERFRRLNRDDKIPVDVLKRVMPKVDQVDLVPHDPTLLETLVDGFYAEVSTGDVSSRIKDDGKNR